MAVSGNLYDALLNSQLFSRCVRLGALSATFQIAANLAEEVSVRVPGSVNSVSPVTSAV